VSQQGLTAQQLVQNMLPQQQQQRWRQQQAHKLYSG
jgi:hypothetical protein